jgi:hypothetical protein
MPVNSIVLFGTPQSEIASLILDRISSSAATSIVTGFATPGGLAAIAGPIMERPEILQSLIVGAATYPGFEALDDLIAAGVSADRLYVHLGHTSGTGGKKNPFARYHPMLHSKVYYMELPGSRACAFIGSHNVTSFALMGLNGEAAVMIEGPLDSVEFDKIRAHINTARTQAVPYTPGMKEAYAWWMREFVEGLKVEFGIPQDWTTVRTILLFAHAAESDRPRTGDQLYFEIPAGIEQIESLKTETHLFLFESLPPNPWEALSRATLANAQYLCITLGVENKQGNREIVADWRIDGTQSPILKRVEEDTFRPNTPGGMQQVRAEVRAPGVDSYEYLFERERTEWDRVLSDENALIPSGGRPFIPSNEKLLIASGEKPLIPSVRSKHAVVLAEARGSRGVSTWKLVKGLTRREGSPHGREEAALKLAAPDSGSFILVSVRRRKKGSDSKERR